MDDPRTDETLMLAYRDGDAAAFAALYGRWRGRLYRYLAHQAARHADELFQDVWLRVVGARAHYQVTARFSTWLFRIAHNRLMDHYRSRKRNVVALYDATCMDGDCGDRPDNEIDPAANVPAPEHDEPPRRLERNELARQILAALAELPEPQREAFLLAEEGGMGLDEIAAATGVGRETAKSRLRYATTRLRQALEGLR